MATTLILSDSPRARYATGAIMYFAQGIPAGLMNIALPAWLASVGTGPGEIASYLAVIALPWAFKLLSGPLMDRYQFPAMGKRRPWVLGAQLGLALAFFGLLLVERPADQIGLLMVLGVLVNVFAATQDVAVDGMAIDLTPVDEQGRLNAFMAFGKSAGWAISAAASGVLLVSVGLGVTGVIAGVFSAAIALAFTLVIERNGERRFPWNRGAVTSDERPGASMSALFRGLNQVLWTRVSLVLMAIMLFDGLVHGYGHALMPIAAVKLFGFTTPAWSQLVAMMGLVGAAVALAIGPMIDRFGAKRMLLLTVALVAVHAFLLAETQFLWQNSSYVRVMLAAWIMLGPVTMVSVIALAMSICGSANSATQFAIYMSVANLGSAAGSKVYGMIAEGTTYGDAYLLLGVLTIAVIAALTLHRPPTADSAGDQGRAAPRYTFGPGVGAAGMYWSGAMRCPKCRADMEQVDVQGVEIDRCAHCKGLWFDAGEIDKVRSRAAARLIDTGDAAGGKVHNAIDRYRCPRCGGPMIRMVDARQPHIWYEKCASCHGSYFDAGEFSDLATVSLSDFFKRFSATGRG